MFRDTAPEEAGVVSRRASQSATATRQARINTAVSVSEGGPANDPANWVSSNNMLNKI